mgnify:CR=1 FL=1
MFIDSLLMACAKFSLENSPGENFLGTQHTAENFETANYRAQLPDNNSFEQWEEDGSLDIVQRANKVWKETLAAYQAPEMDPEIDQKLLDFMATRKKEIPDAFE